MGDLISRQAAIDAIEHRLAEPAYQHTGEDWYVGMNCAESELYDLPSAQPERKTGRWIYLDKDKRFFHPHIVKCSVCNNSLDMYGVNAGRGDANFCPNCGADMRKENQ